MIIMYIVVGNGLVKQQGLQEFILINVFRSDKKDITIPCNNDDVYLTTVSFIIQLDSLRYLLQE